MSKFLSKRSPIFSNLPMQAEHYKYGAEIHLWRAFLDQMFFDTFGAKLVEESRDWLYDRDGKFDPDFYQVCDMAHIDSSLVEMVIEKLEQGIMPNAV